jgi:hypothetical protein
MASLTVPYITAWSDEVATGNLAFETHPATGAGVRLTYTDAVDQDRMFGALWARQGLSRTGRPEWRLVNALRQRRAMLHSLCQVCGHSAVDPASGRTWWVLADDPTDTSQGDGYTNAPPTCRTCIPESLGACPRLRRGAAVYTVGSVEPYGVLAHTFRQADDGSFAKAEENAVIPLDAFLRLEAALATQLLVVLHDLRPGSP